MSAFDDRQLHQDCSVLVARGHTELGQLTVEDSQQYHRSQQYLASASIIRFDSDPALYHLKSPFGSGIIIVAEEVLLSTISHPLRDLVVSLTHRHFDHEPAIFQHFAAQH
jgi:hypothetical protein